jgi:HK97 gp10 family phage protein
MAKGFKFEDNSKQVKQGMKDAGEAGMLAALLLVESDAKSRAAVATGELRDKIDHKVNTKGAEISGQVGSPNEHAIWNEFGTGEHAENGAGRKGGWSYQTPDGKWHHTKGMKAQSFLRPAFRANKKNIQDTIGKEYGIRFKGK